MSSFHERAWLKNDVFSVQVQCVLEVADAQTAKELENAIRKKYEKNGLKYENTKMRLNIQ